MFPRFLEKYKLEKTIQGANVQFLQRSNLMFVSFVKLQCNAHKCKGAFCTDFTDFKQTKKTFQVPITLFLLKDYQENNDGTILESVVQNKKKLDLS